MAHNQHRTSTSTKKHVQQFEDERLAMVEGGWDPQILITVHAGKLKHGETNMAAGATNQMESIGWNFFFTDLEQLVLDFEQLKASNFTTNVSLDETLLERFENAVQALQNVHPHIQHSHSFATLSEIAHNLRLMCCILLYYIRHTDFPCRSRCSQFNIA